ncbi:hem oxygenase-like [Babesia duncani]|nr:hem oxygenase-like [Babesia duncani]
MVDIKTLVDCMQEFIKQNQELQIIAQAGPFDQQVKIAADVLRLERYCKDGEYFVNFGNPSLPLTRYLEQLATLSEHQIPAFLSHVLVFYKEWQLGRHRLLGSIQKHLKIVEKFKCSGHDNDAKNVERLVNYAALQWQRNEKDAFIGELEPALQSFSKALMHHFGPQK